MIQWTVPWSHTSRTKCIGLLRAAPAGELPVLSPLIILEFYSTLPYNRDIAKQEVHEMNKVKNNISYVLNLFLIPLLWAMVFFQEMRRAAYETNLTVKNAIRENKRHHGKA